MDYNIDEQFDLHAMNNVQIAFANDVRAQAKALADLIVHGCPKGRERSLALTKLEECIMWATKSISLEKFDNTFLE